MIEYSGQVEYSMDLKLFFLNYESREKSDIFFWDILMKIDENQGPPTPQNP